MLDTKIINLCGGPGIGKSRTAAKLFGELKDRNVLCELVVERAKDLAWKFDGNPGAYTIQPVLHATQVERQSYSMGKVDYIITDSPTFLCGLYQDTMGYGTPAFQKYVTNEFKRQNNVTINLVRRDNFVAEGRHLDLEEAKGIDDKVTSYLILAGIDYHEWDTQVLTISDLATCIMSGDDITIGANLLTHRRIFENGIQ